MKLVIGFDNWTKGSHHYERLVPTLEEKGYKLLLIHIGSWGHDKNRPTEEYIGKLLVRDINYYRGKSFKKILQKENPVAVIFLSTRAFAHQAFNRYALYLGIPTLHLYHGLLNVQSINDDRKSNYKVNWYVQLSILFASLHKNITKLFPVYWIALLKTNASVSDWYWFFKEIYIKIASKTHNAEGAPDTKTTFGCVYTSVDISHIVRKYRVQPSNVFAVGNPDLILFGLKRTNLGINIDRADSTINDIVYVETLMLDAGLVFDGQADFIRHITDIYESTKAQGFHLVIKLHPGHFRTDVPDRLCKLGIEICNNEDFVARLITAKAAIVMPSTAAIIPALVGLPLFLDQCGKMAEVSYGTVLTG